MRPAVGGTRVANLFVMQQQHVISCVRWQHSSYTAPRRRDVSLHCIMFMVRTALVYERSCPFATQALNQKACHCPAHQRMPGTVGMGLVGVESAVTLALARAIVALEERAHHRAQEEDVEVH